MQFEFTRRRFGQLAIASTIATGLATVARKTSAQAPSLVILGMRPGSPISSNLDQPTDGDFTDIGTGAENSSGGSARSLILQPSSGANLQDGAVQVTAPVLQFGDVLTAFTSLSDGTLIIATRFSSLGKKDNATRLDILGSSVTTVTVSGLKKQEEIVSLLGLNDGSLVGLVAKTNGNPPTRLVTIDLQTGRLAKADNLPGNSRFSNLAQCSDGTLYTTAITKTGETALARLDKKPTILAKLSFNNTAWNNGLSGLVCAPSGQFIALGARRYESPNYLHLVDKNTGVMTRLKAYNFAKITLLRSGAV